MENQPKWHNRLMLDERHPDYKAPKKEKEKDDKYRYDTSGK